MPLKTKHKRTHHVAHHKERRSKHFLKVYAPFIPLLVIVACGITLTSRTEFRSSHTHSVKSYATNTTDAGLLAATNKERAKEKLTPLKFNNQLDQAAQSKAADMAARNYWSHVTPDGKEPWDFIEKADYKYLKAAENLAYGFSNSDSTLVGWMNSPGHRANVMDPDLREVGFGIINIANYQNTGNETLVVAMYGTPANPAVPVPVDSSPVTQIASTTQQPQNISYIQSLTRGKAPWSTLAVGLIIGGIIMYLVIKHARGLRKALKNSERFLIKHPLLDATLLALSVLAAIAAETIGKIQ